MSDNQKAITILPAEFVGTAGTVDGIINIGGVLLDVHTWTTHDGPVDVYVRRGSDDLSIVEIHMVRHDGLACEELDAQNEEAERYPLGAKEYWRVKMVGKHCYGPDHHLMTDADFEEDWAEQMGDEA